jgi:hypothetical protein
MVPVSKTNKEHTQITTLTNQKSKSRKIIGANNQKTLAVFWGVDGSVSVKCQRSARNCRRLNSGAPCFDTKTFSSIPAIARTSCRDQTKKK